ncbi:FCD domain-containing protein [Ottowia sp.]|uniref:FCD domain-containing protein n=1 Tax=Ottowia sp. TaxID=1898956 RepID=UPI002604C783|nr:FCD domain-containing protein [Ottowia sp.]
MGVGLAQRRDLPRLQVDVHRCLSPLGWVVGRLSGTQLSRRCTRLLAQKALRQSIRVGDAVWEASVRGAFAYLSEAEVGGAGRDPEQWERANRRFHEALIAGCSSPWTRHLLDILYRHGERYRHVAIRVGATPGFDRDVHAEHEGIFNAALARQEARAALALEAHIRLTCDMLLRYAHDMVTYSEGEIEAGTNVTTSSVGGNRSF